MRLAEEGFPLAELRCFHWLGLLPGKGKIFLPPAGVVKYLPFQFWSTGHLSSGGGCNQSNRCGNGWRLSVWGD